MGFKVIALDLDRTLWSHSDISITNPPFRRLSDSEIMDSSGDFIKLHECARELIRRAKAVGLGLAVISWNRRDVAELALEAFGLREYFDLLVIENHPNKGLMMEKIVEAMGVKPSEIVYVDDNPSMVRSVKERFKDIVVLQYGRDVQSLCELIDMLALG